MPKNTSAGKSKLPKTTRLANLLLFLKEAEGGVTAREIRDRVEGYGSAQADAAFKRQFRRDRADLSDMGFPVMQEKGEDGIPLYRLDISRTRQESLRLGAKEAALLGICAKNALEIPGFPLRDGLVSALGKLPPGLVPLPDEDAARAGEGGPDEEGEAGDEEIVKAVDRAIREGTALSFAYEAASGEASSRTVVPVSAYSYLGALYLYAFDCDRASMRRFKFSRICGVPEPAAAPEGSLEEARARRGDEMIALPFQVGGLRAEGKAFFSSRIADAAAGLTQGQGILEPCGGGFVWTVDIASADRFVRWAIENGPGILVLEPAEAVGAAARLEEYARRLEGLGACRAEAGASGAAPGEGDGDGPLE